MSVYTDIIIYFEGSDNELKNTISKNFDELDNHLQHLSINLWRFHHHECDMEELRVYITKVARHKKCRGIWSDVLYDFKN